MSIRPILLLLACGLGVSSAHAERDPDVVEKYLWVIAHDAEKLRSHAMVRLGDYLHAAHDAQRKPSSNPAVTRMLELRDLSPVVYDRFIHGWDRWIQGYPSIFRPWLEMSDRGPDSFAELSETYTANKDKSINVGIAAAFRGGGPNSMIELARIYNDQAYSIERLWGERFRGELVRTLKPKADELSMTPLELRAAAIRRVQDAYRKSMTMNPKFDEPTMELVKWLTEPGSPFAIPAKVYEADRLLPKSVKGGFRFQAEAALSNEQ